METVIAFAGKSGLAIERMEGLIRNLLKLTRLDAGNVVFHKEYCKVSELVRRAAEELTDRAGAEKKQLILSEEEKTEVFCDTEWSREALSNLIKNALDHTDEGGRITVTWEQTPFAARIMVTDTGDGVAEEDIHHIFKRFYRSINSRDKQGTGLGLSLVKAILDGQGGTVSVQSEGGLGATFILSFPYKTVR